MSSDPYVQISSFIESVIEETKGRESYLVDVLDINIDEWEQLQILTRWTDISAQYSPRASNFKQIGYEYGADYQRKIHSDPKIAELGIKYIDSATSRDSFAGQVRLMMSNCPNGGILVENMMLGQPWIFDSLSDSVALVSKDGLSTDGTDVVTRVERMVFDDQQRLTVTISCEPDQTGEGSAFSVDTGSLEVAQTPAFVKSWKFAAVDSGIHESIKEQVRSGMAEGTPCKFEVLL